MTITIPGRLEIDRATGHVTGPAHLEYNQPWPCGSDKDHPAGSGFYGSGAIQGVVMHTMVGDLPGTIAEFNNRANGASAHFGIDQSGLIHQFGPIGKGWCAWAQAAGNLTWYSIEHADHGNPDNPLTIEQMTASAQLVELLARFAGFPLQITDRPAGRGYGIHVMGGAAWGGHTCPDLPPKHVRSQQRGDIIALAKLIRDPSPAPPPAVLDGYLVTNGGAGGFAGHAVTSADAGKSWQ